MMFPAKEVIIKDESNIEEYDIILSCGAGTLALEQEHDCIHMTVAEATKLHQELGDMLELIKQAEKPNV